MMTFCRIKILISAVVSLITAVTLYPHSYMANLLWLIGAALSPGTSNSASGWFVFISMFIICSLFGIITYTIISFVKIILFNETINNRRSR